MKHTIPSASLPALTWAVLNTQDNPEPTWVAILNGIIAHTMDDLAAMVGTAWENPSLRFEAWHAFTLGMDVFAPIVHPSAWKNTLVRAPINPGTGLPNNQPVAFEHVRPPHIGPYGLEGCIIHPASGHVLRAIVGGLPPQCDLPVLVPLTTNPANSNLDANPK
jgi:hypothetical protein